MGDLRGRVHVAKQDLSKLQTRKMKGLKAGRDVEDDDEMETSDDEAAEDTSRKRRKVQ